MIPPEDLRYTIEEIIKKEDATGEERKKIHKYEDSILHTKKEINEYNKHLKELETEFHKVEENIDKFNCERLNLRIQLDAVKKISEKTFEAYERDTKKTEEMQQLIWKNRINYCEKVTDFIKKYGLAATLNRNFDLKVREQMADALCDTDVLKKNGVNKQPQEKILNTSQQTSILQNLQCKVKNEKLLESEIIEELKNVLIENEQLEKDYNDGQEFIRLRNAYKYSRDGLICLQDELRKIEGHTSNQIVKEPTPSKPHGKSPGLKQATITDTFKLSRGVRMKMQESTNSIFPIDDVPSMDSGRCLSINNGRGGDFSGIAAQTPNMTSGLDIYSNDYTRRLNGPELGIGNNAELQCVPTRKKDVYKEIETIKKKAIKRRQKTIFTYVVPKKFVK